MNKLRIEKVARKSTEYEIFLRRRGLAKVWAHNPMGWGCECAERMAGGRCGSQGSIRLREKWLLKKRCLTMTRKPRSFKVCKSLGRKVGGLDLSTWSEVSLPMFSPWGMNLDSRTKLLKCKSVLVNAMIICFFLVSDREDPQLVTVIV